MTPGAITVRVATPGDIPAMHRIRMSVRENRLREPLSVQPAHYVPMLATRGCGWVAVGGGTVAGFAIADRSRANIWALFVDPEREGAGLGRALHRRMMDWLFAHGVETAWLTTEPGTRAERLYLAAGWRFSGLDRGEARYELTRRDWVEREVGALPVPSNPAALYGVQLRTATEGDVAFLLALRREVMHPHLVVAGSVLTEAEHLERVRLRFESTQVIERNGEPVGMIKVARGAARREVLQLQIGAAAQGAGLGAALLMELIAQSRRDGVPLGLSVLFANPARHLYERLGFRIVGETGEEFEMLHLSALGMVGVPAAPPGT